MGGFGGAVTERDDRVPAAQGGARTGRKPIVYRFYNDRDELLYVGSTINWDRRHDTHRRKTAWYPEVHHHILDEFTTILAARKFEDAVIATGEPRYNIAQGVHGRPVTDPATHRVKAAFTFRPQVLRLLEQLAREGDTTKSAILETAIRRLAQEGER